MAFWRKLKIGPKLILGFGILIGLMLAGYGLGISAGNRATQEINRTTNLRAPSESMAALKEAATCKQIPLLLLDRQGFVAGLYAAQTTPHVYVINDTGRLRYRGAVDDTSFARREPTRFYLEEAVDAVLSGKAPAVSDTEPYGCAIIRHELE